MSLDTDPQIRPCRRVFTRPHAIEDARYILREERSMQVSITPISRVKLSIIPK